MADNSNKIKVENTVSRESLPSSAEPVEFIAVNVKVENELESEEEAETNDLFSMVKDEAKEIKVEEIDSLSGDIAFESSSRCTSDGNFIDAGVIIKQEDMGPCVEEKESTQVDFNSEAALENKDIVFFAKEELSQEIDEFELSSQVPAVSSNLDAELIIPDRNESDSLSGHSSWKSTENRRGFDMPAESSNLDAELIIPDRNESDGWSGHSSWKSTENRHGSDVPVSSNLDRKFTVPDCDKNESVQADSSAFSSEKSFSAADRGEKFQTKQHVTLVNKKSFACPHCCATFSLKNSLTRHLPVHSTEKPYSCPQCAATFKTKDTLSKHKIVHSKEKPFSCGQCPATFSTKIYMKRHLAVHSSEEPFSCTYCSATFRYMSNLKQHLALHKGI